MNTWLHWNTWLRVLMLGTGVILGACEDDLHAECKDPDPSGSVPDCVAVCAHLFELSCNVGSSAEECARICVASDAVSDFPQVMRCYQAANNCDDVDGCSRGCGPDASAVPFAPVILGGDAANDEDGG